MELELIQIYKFARLPVLVLAIGLITAYVYNKKRKVQMEDPKYRMLEED
ncbi:MULTISPECIES: cytochrome oxidase maturation protein [Leptospira]|uniref:CcoQ/FixQ family Cbb3-type cytochrome c oxidase assembly chaperone n=4 Tax=Leptospira TaxID=171 RepID=A0A2M9YM15_9LEPT|nr:MULTISPECIES: cytochrome oxidase maturation protein [Leptospira]AOP34288.1 cytochrome oxidase maturation protein [Leptospira tipperaryensis]MBM9499441.1 cbb3-type cytochrome c oxidase subunit 3 [Leptospira ainazelensis]MBM9575766.1 cbb3-type cytochrome c oxidase subunit 3 [Leptospira ainlahdjerensis]PJZ52567.1 CcoQ/FixQ family Cbb3-type cytochrome c oxidase assembly chaperone [Leptospira adleri]PJZ60962.1 CcoQ/FixQ family Cbb3-type cytochrome c oxidase assembly chaperone [Leptospira adleri]